MSNKIFKNINNSSDESKELSSSFNNQEHTLGGKIKNLRKQLNMTQTDLAGDEMTNSMLSQIENNLVNPSVKSLQYLASKLGQSVAYFIDNTNKADTALPIDEIEDAIKSINNLYEASSYEEANTLLDDILKKYEFDKSSKLFADLQYKSGLCSIKLNLYEDAQKKVNTAIDIYIYNHQYTDAAKAYMELMILPWLEFDYDKCLEILDKAHELYLKSVIRDTVFEIEYLCSKAIIHSAKDDNELTLDILNKALDISDKSGVYYKADELYRMLAAVYLLNEKYDDFKYYIEKAHQFAQFTQNQYVLISYDILYAVYENNVGNYKKALEHLVSIKDNMNQASSWYHSECARTYYLLKNYDECIEQSHLVDYSQKLAYKTDYLKLWSAKIYEGLSLSKLGKVSEGIESVKIAIDKMSILGTSDLLILAFKVLSELYGEAKDYENAFKALKEADNTKITHL